MQDSLIHFFNQYLDLTEEETLFLRKNIPIKSLDKNQHLLNAGSTSTALYFVLEGIIRMYYLVDGIEKTTFFYQKNDFVSSYESFTKQVPSKHYLQTIKKSTVAVFSHSTVREIVRKFPRFEILSKIMMEQELIIYQNMLASFVTMNAEQRFSELLKNKANLLQEIPQYHIATYLGVSPETLSRIRKRIRKKH